MNSTIPALTPEQAALVRQTLGWLKIQSQRPGSCDQFIRDVRYVRAQWRKAGIAEADFKKIKLMK